MQNKNKVVSWLMGWGMALMALNAQAAVSTTDYDYDLDAGTVTVTDDNNKRIVSHYDVVNRLDKIELPDMDGGMQLFDFEYDATDQLTSATYPGGQQSFTYDGLDRLETLSEFGISGLLKFYYDHQDRLTQITYGNNNGAVCYQYDPDGRITRVGRIPAGESVPADSPADCGAANVEKTDYNYDAKGRLDTRTYPNGVQSYWDYDAATGQLKEIGHQKADGTLIYSDTFAYVPGTNLYKRITRTTTAGPKTTDYTYDAHQRLETVTEPDGRRTVYQYDAFGNRTHETITNINDAQATGGSPKPYGDYRYVYNGNRLIDIHYTAPGAAETLLEAFTYDNVGRIKTRDHQDNGLTTYTWDDRGYLIELSKPGTTISYTYNALGARTGKTVNGVTTQYVTAPVFGMNHVLMEMDGSNNVTGRYVYGGHQQLIQEPSPANSAADQYLLHGSSVGNITHALDRNQSVVNEYDYDAFGNRTIVAGDSSTTFGYTGEQYDDESGLMYLRARYYDPMIGRFITVDPYLGRLAEPVTQNRYIYVHNNPLGLIDPSGNAVNFIFQAVFGCTVGGAGGGGVAYAKNESWIDAAIGFGVGCVSGGVTALANPAVSQLVGVEAAAFTVGVISNYSGQIASNVVTDVVNDDYIDPIEKIDHLAAFGQGAGSMIYKAAGLTSTTMTGELSVNIGEEAFTLLASQAGSSISSFNNVIDAIEIENNNDTCTHGF